MYFITCFTKYDTNTLYGVPKIGHSHTFGYYETKEAAIEAVLGNYCDIFEQCYTYAVVEYIKPGLYNPATERWFFKWNDKKCQYEPIEPFIDHWGNYAFT